MRWRGYAPNLEKIAAKAEDCSPASATATEPDRAVPPEVAVVSTAEDIVYRGTKHAHSISTGAGQHAHASPKLDRANTPAFAARITTGHSGCVP